MIGKNKKQTSSPNGDLMLIQTVISGEFTKVERKQSPNP